MSVDVHVCTCMENPKADIFLPYSLRYGLSVKPRAHGYGGLTNHLVIHLVIHKLELPAGLLCPSSIYIGFWGPEYNGQ